MPQMSDVSRKLPGQDKEPPPRTDETSNVDDEPTAIPDEDDRESEPDDATDA